MAHIAIPIPNVPGKQDIEIEVTINGQKQALHYRVELFYWSDCTGSQSLVPTFDRVECIQQLLASYDQDWALYYIGAPTDEFVPITFVRREDLIKQRRLRQLA
ncbi:hypothetical protein [Fibrivirga algicola]|uniref:Uncharacterized protein n=1 Tax=Fibrivirga algicola TaxID=2950420 RepID=A0ABX0QK19_9BACT|nr:hypothetical protein [Fibrivirga algicola]ARK09572.1 hypothetical protein A6C57_04060 [Fibrella sp. ES10-3-2-2]NID10454.1 hypothetical protein [Fibrivirga algicola]